MEDNSNQLEALLNKEQWTTEEIQWLLNYLESSEGTELKKIMKQDFSGTPTGNQVMSAEVSWKLLKAIHKKAAIPRERESRRMTIFSVSKIMVAASVISFVILSAYLLIRNETPKQKGGMASHHEIYKNDIDPGGDKAILILSDGKRILLDTAANGTLGKEGTSEIDKRNSEIAYSSSSTTSDQKEILYNTIVTPRGGQYQVLLPDGSRVWLNAASSICFPTSFIGKERRVEISGEVYFEVKKNASMPFIVEANGAEIRVLGTHFNVMAYADEATLKTTLLEGAVQFVKGDATAKLAPGQQSQLDKGGHLRVLSDVNTNEVIAWKNEMFDFEGADVETIMRQLGRWYDVEIIYNQKPVDLFYAEIPRATKLSDVLKALELTGKIKFEIEGRRIRVME